MRLSAPRLLAALVCAGVLAAPSSALALSGSAHGPRAAAQPTFDTREVRLPTSASWALPPMIDLRASPATVADGAGMRRWVLRSPRLLLSPAARRAVRNGTTSASALALLASMPRLGSPLLVFSATGGDLRVQATTQSMTRLALQSIISLPEDRRPRMQLHATATASADHAAPHGGELGAQAVALAERYLGIPYVWGSANPKVGLDCSGLTMLVYRRLGVSLDHYAAFQWLEGERVAPNRLIAGDLVFFDMGADGPGHVGLYAGNGQFIQAPHTGDVVRISTLRDYAASYVGAVRPYS